MTTLYVSHPSALDHAMPEGHPERADRIRAVERALENERFAGLVQREIVARTDLVDLRTHPKTWELLRHTRMPAVRLDVGYLTNATDAARLDDPAFRDLLAEAIVVAVQRYYLSPEIDARTGILRFDEIREGFRR